MNTSPCLSVVQSLDEEKIPGIGAEEWKKCDHLKNVEELYALREAGIDNLIEAFVINIQSNSDTESCGDNSDDD